MSSFSGALQDSEPIDATAEQSSIAAQPECMFGNFRHAGLIASGLILVLTLYYLPLLSGRTSYFLSDHTYFFEPFSNFIADAYSQGKLPLWNKYLYCGMSQLAVPSPGLFYPGTFLYLCLHYSQALALQMLLHQLLAGLGMFLFVSSLGWGTPAAAISALIFAMCGYMFSLPANFTLVATASCLPITLWSFRAIATCRQKETKNRIWWFSLIASLSIYLLIAAGRPEVFAPGLSLLSGYSIIDGVMHMRRGVPPGRVVSAWWWQACALATGVMLTMPVVLPLAEWAKLSPRSHGLSASHALMWSVNWYDLLCTTFPRPLGDLQILGARYLNLVATRPVFMPFIPSLFIGPICVCLAIYGYFDATWGWRRWLLFCTFIFLIVCLGEYTPVVPYVVRMLPVATVLRFPVKMMIFPLLFTAIAAGRGASVIVNRNVSLPAHVTNVAIWSFALIAALALLAIGLSDHDLHLQKSLFPHGASLLLGKAILGEAVIALLLCLFVHYFGSHRALTAKTATIVILVGLVTNLLVVALCTRQQTVGSNFYEQKPILSQWLADLGASKKGRLLNLYFDPLEVPSDYRYEPGASWTPSFFAYTRQALLANSNVEQRQPETFGYEAAETSLYRTMILNAVTQSAVDARKKTRKEAPELLDLALLRICQSTGTKWLASQVYRDKMDTRVLNAKYFAVVKEDRHINLRLYKPKGETPRYYFARFWHWTDPADITVDCLRPPKIYQYAPLSVPCIERGSAEEVVRTVEGLGPDLPEPPKVAPALPASMARDLGGADSVKRSVLSSAPASEAHGTPSPGVPGTVSSEVPGIRSSEAHSGASETVEEVQAPDSSVWLLDDQAEHVVLSVVNRHPGFVILSDHYYPGWCATVDGVPTKLFKANVEMRAVYLAAGSHSVEFDFRPASLSTGLWIASAGLTMLTLYFLCGIGPYLWRFVKATAGQ